MLLILEEYEHNSVEKKWQEKWIEANLGRVDPDSKKEKFFLIFAYPNPTGFMHTGHTRGFSYSDIITRYKRMKGYNVLFPYGVHASGNGAIGVSIKIQRNPEWVEYLKRNGVSDEDIKKMGDDSNYVVEYFTKNFEKQFQSFGFLMDFRRTLTTIDEGYKKFIQWQFMKLHEKGLLTQGQYFATFCVKCGPVAVDPAEMEISKGGTAEKNEYTLLKFKYGDDYIMAATLRPETVYGQTNMWADPNVNYVRIKVDNETWIVSKSCAEKLKYQKKNVEILEEVPGKDLMGKKCIAPKINREIPILPSHFCDPNVGTGLVTCVPSDAPYDYIALEDLKKNKEEQKKYKLKPEDVNLEVIKIINTPKYGNFAAKKACEEFGISSQQDTEKLEQATQAVYKDGFHAGKLTNECGDYAGMMVTAAKDKMKEEMIEKGEADTMYDLSEEVICRCGSPVIIKKVDDQWFIKYSDHDLTETSKAHAESMDIFPEEYKKNVPNVLDWFQDRACTRMGNLMGTKFPFDDKWIIEPIADSTLYPMYYTISKYINEGSVKAEEMDEAWFDYVFLGKGNAKNDVHKKAKEEFDYWYPLDINVGGKEHQTVHFPVFIMNHVAVLNQKDWAKGIFINWWVTGKSGKLSKSKGGVEAVPDAAQKYSVDAMRLYYSHVASPFVDMVWDAETITPYKNQVKRLYSLVNSLIPLMNGNANEMKHLDKWMLSKLNRRIMETSNSMERYDLKKAVDSAFFGLMSDLAWYRKRGGSNSEILKETISKWLKLLTPFAPHICEECWHILGNDSFISIDKYPEADESKINDSIEQSEKVIINLADDIDNIIKLTKKQPSKITLFVAPEWKRKIYLKASAMKNPKQLISEVMQDDEVKKQGKDAVTYVSWLGKHSNELQMSVLSTEDELNAINEASLYLKSMFSAQIDVVKAEESDNPKTKAALPMKPAVYLE